mgnify:FL=1
MFVLHTIRVFLLLLIISSFGIDNLSAQPIGMQMGSMRQMADQGPEATLARLKELGVTEIEGGLPRGVKLE